MKYFMTQDIVTAYLENGAIVTWHKDDAAFEQACDACRKLDEEMLVKCISPIKKLVNEEADVEITEDQVIIDSIPVSGDNAFIKLIHMLKDRGVIDKEIKSIIPFLRRVAINPYIDCAMQLYEFMVNGQYEITPDGCLLAYKGVNNDYTSNNNFKNPIGEWVYENDFDVDRDNVCSKGLHFCAKAYLDEIFHRDKYLVVKVPPENIVSITTDESGRKGRATGYFIVRELESKQTTIADTDEEIVKEGKPTVAPSVIKTIFTLFPNKTIAEVKLKDFDHIDPEMYDKTAKYLNINVKTVKRNEQRYKAYLRAMNESK